MGILRRPHNLKKSLSYFRQERRVLYAQQRTCQKVDEDFSKQMWSSPIIQTLCGKIFKTELVMKNSWFITTYVSNRLLRLKNSNYGFVQIPIVCHKFHASCFGCSFFFKLHNLYLLWHSNQSILTYDTPTSQLAH